MDPGPFLYSGSVHCPRLKMEPARSIQPIPQAVNEVAFIIAGNGLPLGTAAEGGQLQFNAFVPVIAHLPPERVLNGLTEAMGMLRANCVMVITP